MNKIVKSVIVVMCACLLIFPAVGNAIEFFGANPVGTPSVLYYARDGVIVGLVSGVSVGYLQNQNDAKMMADGAIIGTLLGMAGGIVLGVIDVDNGKKGIGAIILRDMNLGGGIGIIAGTLIGGLDVINNNKWESVGKDAATGYLAGVVLGLGIAVYEGPIIAQRYGSLDVKPVFIADSRNTRCPGLGFSKNF